MLPGFIMGYYLVSTTTVSEFVAAMERMHVPEKIVIPVSVVFRFFPTVKEEYAAIRDAMKMRGITTLRSPMKMLEYRVVPLMMSIAKIGEELSAEMCIRDSIKEMTKALGSIGRNINQIARRVNAGGPAYQADMEEIRERIDVYKRQCWVRWRRSCLPAPAPP